MTSPVVEGLFMIHKVITRGLTTSIRKCDEYLGKQGIPPAEADGFSMYVSTLKRVTHSHHLSEDEIAFPYFKNYIDAPYDRLRDDHQKMALILDNMDKAISEIASHGVGNLHEVLGEFEKLWVPHIKIEEENFTSEKLNKEIEMKEQVNLTEKLSSHGRSNSGPGPIVLPFLIYNLEDKYREAFLMRLPWFVKKVLVPIVWKGKWKPMGPFLI